MNLSDLIGWIFRLLIALGGGVLMEYIFPAQGWGWRVQDLLYSRFQPSSPDTQIVIVDIAQLGRAELARLLLRLSEAGPKAIAIDAVFAELRSPHEDTLWMQALCTAAKRTAVFLACSLDLSHEIEKAPIVPVSHELFTQCAQQAFANLLQGDTVARIVRECLLYTVSGKDTALSLGTIMALMLRPSLRETIFTLPARMPIRYRGNLNHFYSLSGEEILADSLPLSWLRHKVLFMGVADPLRRTMEDIFFSPLTSSFLNRSLPDMYGVVIHANITSMLIHRDLFKELSREWAILGAFAAFMILSLVSLQFRNTTWRPLVIRIMQIGLLWGGVELTLWLGEKGYWFPVEVCLWSILIAGEMELWRCPSSRFLV
ncbi:MAG: CHASE2 domain-containing protein [Bacteroidia bacterium]